MNDQRALAHARWATDDQYRRPVVATTVIRGIDQTIEDTQKVLAIDEIRRRGRQLIRARKR